MNLKTFAQEGRRRLMAGVSRRLDYWGFDSQGQVTEVGRLHPPRSENVFLGIAVAMWSSRKRGSNVNADLVSWRLSPNWIWTPMPAVWSR